MFIVQCDETVVFIIYFYQLRYYLEVKSKIIKRKVLDILGLPMKKVFKIIMLLNILKIMKIIRSKYRFILKNFMITSSMYSTGKYSYIRRVYSLLNISVTLRKL